MEDHKKIPVNLDNWIKENHIIIMNVAGPKESEEPIYDRTLLLLKSVLSHFKI